MPKNTQADEERGMVTPQKPKKINTDNLPKDVSPDKTAPLSPQSVTIDIHEKGRSRGVMGMTRIKSMIVMGTGLALAGGLAYFLLKWFEIPGLEEQIDRLENEIDRLGVENDRFEVLNNEINDTIVDLKGINVALNETTQNLQETNQELGFKVAGLKQENEKFAAQNDILSKTVNDLQLISTFLDETSEGLNESFEQITQFLEDQVAFNKANLLGAMETTYRQREDKWNCDFGTKFAGKPYALNNNAEIPTADHQSILDYASERVLTELCLDRQEFEAFLKLPDYTPLTTNKLNAAMIIYVEKALDWYFPNGNGAGLTHDDWLAASFECKKLNATQKFTSS